MSSSQSHQNDIHVPERVFAQLTAEIQPIGVSSAYQILKFACFFVVVFSSMLSATPHGPAKRCDSANHKKAETAQRLETPL